MQKTLLVVPILLLSLTTRLLAQAAGDLYGATSNSVVYIEQAIRILPDYFPDTRLIAQLEKKVDRKLVGTYMSLESGTGFFIDSAGHVVTNNHVIDNKNEKTNRENAGQSWGRYIDDTFSEREMSVDDKRILKVALFKAITQGPLFLQVLVGNKDFYIAKVLTANSTVDLALLEIPLAGSPALGLAPDSGVIVGDDVFSLGYPFGPDAVKKFNDISSTFTKGSVSAFREQGLIQHTATINPGNSGGPLINVNGLVVGINVAMRTNANNTYFAIPVQTLRQFLVDRNYSSFLANVPALPKLTQETGQLHQNSLGEYEVSSDLVFNQEKGSIIYIDGKQVGVTPFFWNPKTSPFDLRIEGASGFSEGKFRVLESLRGSTEVKIPWNPFTAKVSVTTAAKGTRILVDGKFVGRSPLTQDVLPGQHTFGAEAKGMRFESVNLSLAKNEDRSLEIAGEPIFSVRFQGTGERPSVKAVQGSKTYAFGPTDEFVLSSGTWEISWKENDSYNEGQATLTVTTLGAVFDARPSLAHGSIKIRNLSPQAQLVLDNDKPIAGVDTPIDATVGTHILRVYQKGFTPLTLNDVVVQKGKATELTLSQKPSAASYGGLVLWSGVGGAVLGAALAGFGYYEYGDSIALANTNNYESYQNWKNGAQAQFTSGLLLSGAALITVAVGLLLNSKLDQDGAPNKPYDDAK